MFTKGAAPNRAAPFFVYNTQPKQQKQTRACYYIKFISKYYRLFAQRERFYNYLRIIL